MKEFDSSKRYHVYSIWGHFIRYLDGYDDLLDACNEFLDSTEGLLLLDSITGRLCEFKVLETLSLIPGTSENCALTGCVERMKEKILDRNREATKILEFSLAELKKMLENQQK